MVFDDNSKEDPCVDLRFGRVTALIEYELPNSEALYLTLIRQISYAKEGPLRLVDKTGNHISKSLKLIG
jgi:hypothetical protein